MRGYSTLRPRSWRSQLCFRPQVMDKLSIVRSSVSSYNMGIDIKRLLHCVEPSRPTPSRPFARPLSLVVRGGQPRTHGRVHLVRAEWRALLAREGCTARRAEVLAVGGGACTREGLVVAVRLGVASAVRGTWFASVGRKQRATTTVLRQTGIGSVDLWRGSTRRRLDLVRVCGAWGGSTGRWYRGVRVCVLDGSRDTTFVDLSGTSERTCSTGIRQKGTPEWCCRRELVEVTDDLLFAEGAPIGLWNREVLLVSRTTRRVGHRLRRELLLGTRATCGRSGFIGETSSCTASDRGSYETCAGWRGATVRGICRRRKGWKVACEGPALSMGTRHTHIMRTGEGHLFHAAGILR